MQEDSTMDNILEKENPTGNWFGGYHPKSDDPHDFGKCMEGGSWKGTRRNEK